MVAKTTKKAKAGEKAAKKKAVAKKTTKKAPSNKKASSVKMKLFRDTVHGYIEIPEQYCDKLIDTPEFQRLRRIEQTSMRVLYPCARHDRFSHSLGVYHLGSIACRHMLTNSKDQIEKSIPSPSNREKLKRSFEIACLLHDVGHSPFSHSFEKYFDIPENLDQRLIDAVGNSDKEFKPDLKRVTPKEHERASALLVLAKFKNEIKNLNADPVLVVRMIIGCRYHKHVTAYEEICNCLIDLLNGKAIDVDKLDYVSRDKWASGTNSSNVDLHRLLSSVCLRKHSSKLKICFYKSALSVVESVLEAKNFQYLWIFSHHKVAYDQYVLKKAVETLAL
ncbi:MAG: HD domain-containing protein, partial [Verrucomicrobia bacterium]|nr:HD domain-containing protein [Verrucomicrobiota bacterium]